MKSTAHEKDQQIKNMENLKLQLEEQLLQVCILLIYFKSNWNLCCNFFQNLKQLETAFNMKFKEVERLLTEKLLVIIKRLLKLREDVEFLKRGFLSKNEASSKLLKLMENMRLESSDINAFINRLKIENNALTAEKVNYEKCMAELSKTLNERELQNNELQMKNVGDQ